MREVELLFICMLCPKVQVAKDCFASSSSPQSNVKFFMFNCRWQRTCGCAVHLNPFEFPVDVIFRDNSLLTYNNLCLSCLHSLIHALLTYNVLVFTFDVPELFWIGIR